MPTTDFDFIDLHYHASPDLYQRRYTAFEAGRIYQQHKGAVVLRSHLGETSVQATLAQQEGLPVFPSVALNHIAGGIDYRVVLRALANYQPTIPSRLIVDLPTITGRQHQSKLVRSYASAIPEKFLSKSACIFNEDQKTKSAVIDIMKVCCDYPLILSTGHASKAEVYALIELSQIYNLPYLLLNQPANPLTGLSVKELKNIAKNKKIYAEQTALTYCLKYQNDADFASVLRDVPQLVYSSDFGQTTQMDINAWLKKSKQWFHQFQITTARQRDICSTHPAQLVLL